MSGSLKFGTSGLRGLVTELCGAPAYAYTRAYCAMLADDGFPRGSGMLIARDLRASSPDIAELCIQAIADSGFTPLDCGAVPTPALALLALREGLPAVMVTGSHIPEDRNGLKFYRATGEIDKADEQRILAHHARLAIMQAPPPSARAERRDALSAYATRYAEFFPPDGLAGLRVGIYQHSSVARDMIADILSGMGATVLPFARAGSFIPVDTEAIRPEDRELARAFAAENRVDAIVSTDGDADRPLVADEAGAFLRGDLIGAMTAASLGADAIVTPVTSNSALEACGKFASIRRTRVGSPFVLEGMAEAAASGARVVVGFEANGGVLLGSDVAVAGRRLAALPTRDAMLPILAILREIAHTRRPLSDLIRSYRFKIALSDRIPHVAAEKSLPVMARLEHDGPFADATFAPWGGIAGRDTRDGLRMTTGAGDIVHLRQSGNAPELRVYVEAADEVRAGALLEFALTAARTLVA